MMQPGATAARLEVRARWAYGEMCSTRFGAKYLSHKPSQGVLDCVSRGDAFESVAGGLWSELDSLLDLARPNEFHSHLSVYQTFTCVGWSKTDLNSAYALPAFSMPDKRNPIRYSEFFNGRPNTGAWSNGTQWIIGFAEESDPRVAAFRTPDIPQRDPGIAVPYNDSYILFEGYLRSILYMRTLDDQLKFLVWVPDVT